MLSCTSTPLYWGDNSAPPSGGGACAGVDTCHSCCTMPLAGEHRLGSRISKGEAQRRRVLGAQATFPMIFFVREKKNARLAGPASLHTSFPSPPTDNSSAPSTCFASRAGTAHAKLVRGIHPLARRTLQTMLQRMLFQQFRSFTSKDQTNALLVVQCIFTDCSGVFGEHSLQLYLRGRETLSKPAPDDAFSSRTAA